MRPLSLVSTVLCRARIRAALIQRRVKAVLGTAGSVSWCPPGHPTPTQSCSAPATTPHRVPVRWESGLSPAPCSASPAQSCQGHVGIAGCLSTPPLLRCWVSLIPSGPAVGWEGCLCMCSLERGHSSCLHGQCCSSKLGDGGWGAGDGGEGASGSAPTELG